MLCRGGAEIHSGIRLYGFRGADDVDGQNGAQEDAIPPSLIIQTPYTNY